MEKKIMKPTVIILEVFIILYMITIGFGLTILLCLCAPQDQPGTFVLFIIMLLFWIFFLTTGFIRYHKDHIEIAHGKVIIDQKVMEWAKVDRWMRKDSWIHQRMEIDPMEVSRIGFSYEMYGKNLYYHSEVSSREKSILHYQGAYEEVTIEMKDGRKCTFDPLLYTLKQLREVIDVLSRDGEVQISAGLRKTLRRRMFERKIR